MRDTWFVSVEIAGEGVDPLALTRDLGIAPTRSSDALAQPGTSGLGSPTLGFWILDTTGQVAGSRLADHLHWLADRLASKEDILRRLATAGHACLLVQGSPDAWERDATAEEQRARLALPLSFVVFVKGDPSIRVGRVEFGDR